MNSEWKEKRLGEVIKLEYGKPLSKEKRTLSGKYPVYGANGEKTRTNEIFYDKKSIIVGRKGSAGEINLTERRFWPLDVTYFVKYDDRECYLEFLYNLLLTLNLPKFAKGVKPGINRNDIYQIRVNIPSLPEQKRIVNILNGIFEKIVKSKENAEKNLQNARELFESYSQSIFENSGDEWEKKTLSEIADIKGGKRVPKGYRLRTQPTDYPYIRVADFNDYGSINLNNIHYISENVFKQIKNYTISSNDLYISIAGTIGKTGIIPKELEGANLTENACKLVFKENIDPKFVYYFTKTPNFLVQTGLNTRVTAMPKLALRRLSNIRLNIPKSLSEQKCIVIKFDAISAETKKLEAIYQQKLDDLEELKKSILQKAFKGELIGGRS